MFRAKLITAGVIGAGLAVGCTGLPKLPDLTETADTRAQVADDAADSDPNATVGQRTAIGNVEPIPVHGVGLVYKLHGTGSSPAMDQWRSTLEHTFRKKKLNPREMLDDPDRTSSLVLVSAIIPPGARTGDKLDVTITLPPSSKTTSLKHGVLYPTELRNMELASNARQALEGLEPLQLARPMLAERQAWRRSARTGQAVTELARPDPKASTELRLLYGAIYHG